MREREIANVKYISLSKWLKRAEETCESIMTKISSMGWSDGDLSIHREVRNKTKFGVKDELSEAC